MSAAGTLGFSTVLTRFGKQSAFLHVRMPVLQLHSQEPPNQLSWSLGLSGRQRKRICCQPEECPFWVQQHG